MLSPQFGGIDATATPFIPPNDPARPAPLAPQARRKQARAVARVGGYMRAFHPLIKGSSTKGFTLIELMVTIAVLSVLLVIAIPSFADFRERASVRGAGDQLVSFWANARLEALKRDAPIAVVIRKSTNNMCVGASTAAGGCDCFTANACDVGQYRAPRRNGTVPR